MKASPVHRAGRLVTSLWWQVRGAPEPSAADLAWAHDVLSSSEAALFDAMATIDRRHSLGVARAVAGVLAETGPSAGDRDGRDRRWMVVAGLTHDVGKATTHLGVLGRVAGTILGLLGALGLVGGSRPVAAPGDGWWGRVRRYAAYPEVGARLLSEAGAHEHVVAWAREHHRDEGEWTVPPADGRLLAAADDGRL